MKDKRYAIVRVDDNWCPNVFDNISMEFICSNKTNIRSEENCKKCRYGDTKEQLIRKIVQVLLRRFKSCYKGNFITVEMVEKQYLETAKEIVEFLGVK